MLALVHGCCKSFLYTWQRFVWYAVKRVAFFVGLWQEKSRRNQLIQRSRQPHFNKRFLPLIPPGARHFTIGYRNRSSTFFSCFFPSQAFPADSFHHQFFRWNRLKTRKNVMPDGPVFWILFSPISFVFMPFGKAIFSIIRLFAGFPGLLNIKPLIQTGHFIYRTCPRGKRTWFLQFLPSIENRALYYPCNTL